MIHANIAEQYNQGMSRVKTLLQLLLSIVLVMLFVLVMENYINNRAQVPAPALMEHTVQLLEAKKTSPAIVPKFKYTQTVEDAAHT